MDSEAELQQAYDAYPYESYALKQTHPSHLFTLGTLLGLDPIPYQKARILELACASGGNLIPMAYHERKASFLGIDISLSQINQGKRMIADLKLHNISLIAQSILDFNSDEKFDYIICHGLFSWVQKKLRTKVLQICQQNLTSQGIAYISYNTYPGWIIANTLRDMLLYQTKALSLPEKIAHVRFLLKILTTTLNQDTPYISLLFEEAKLIATHSDNQLIHEHLSHEHHPLFFYQFVERIESFSLEYLGDATFFEENTNISHLQNQDYLQNRRFRSSLICHKNAHQHFTRDFKLLKAAYAKLAPKLIDEQDILLSQKPCACKLAQYQASKQPYVTNKYHENILLTPLAQALMPFLDGEHDLATLYNIIIHWVRDGILAIVDSQQRPITDTSLIAKQVEILCQKTLKLLGQRSLLVSETYDK